MNDSLFMPLDEIKKEGEKSPSTSSLFVTVDEEKEEKKQITKEVDSREIAKPVIGAVNNVVHNTITGPLESVAAGFNKANAATLNAFGFKEGAKLYEENAKYWEDKAKSPPLIKAIYEGVGSSPMGMAEFMAGPVYAGVKGTVDSIQRSLDKGDYDNSAYVRAVKDGAIAAASRYGLGKAFEALNLIPLTQVQRAGAMGALFGFQSSSEQLSATGSIDPVEVTASILNGAALSMGGLAGEKAEIYKNLIKEGSDAKTALDLASRDNPALKRAVDIATDFTGVSDTRDVEVKRISKNLNLVKEDLTKTNESLTTPKLETETKEYHIKSGGAILSDITPKVILEDIDGMYSVEAGWDATKVAIRNRKYQEISDKLGYQPDIVSMSSHRAVSLLMEDLRDIADEYKANGVLGRIAGATPDFGADTVNSLDANGKPILRGHEITAWDKKLGSNFGTKIVALLDDRGPEDFPGWEKKLIQTTGGFNEEHALKLGELFKEKLPDVHEMARQIGSFDPKLKEHGEHVASIVAKMGRILNLPDNVIHEMVMGSWVHDFGKIKVPKEILNSDTSLTPDQFKVVKTHTDVSDLFDFENDNNISDIVKNIIKYHHEKFDGTGYSGVKGKDIPIEAQIVSAADVYDALTTNSRNYRKQASQEELLKIFEKMKDSNFEPKILDALFEAVELKTKTITKAYHGSPTEFNKFSMEKVGTGEGGQAYGFGLYFAEESDVANFYYEKLQKKNKSIIPDAREWAVEAKSNGKATDENAIKWLKETKHSDDPVIQEAIKLIETGKWKTGKVYEVILKPRQEQYLLWDEPFENQSPYVQKIMETFPEYTNPKKGTGGDFYTRVQTISPMDNTTFRSNKESASNWLLKEGIRGIKYKDQNSRIGEKKTSNYVIFSDEDIEIVQPFQEQIAKEKVKKDLIPIVENVQIEKLSPKENEIHTALVEIIKRAEGKDGKIVKFLSDFIAKHDPGVVSNDKDPINFSDQLKQEKQNANKELQEDYLKVEELAKKENLSVEKYLTKNTELSPENIRDFLLIGKDIANGKRYVERSITKMINELRVELKIDKPELDYLIKELTGFDNYKDLTIFEKQKVQDTLLYMYKKKTGINNFVEVSKFGYKILIRDSNRAFAEQTLAPRSLFGISEITKDVGGDARSYLRNQGPSSKTFVDNSDNIIITSDLKFANLFADKQKITKGLSKEEKQKVVDIVDPKGGIKTSEIQNLEVSQKIKDAALFLRKSFNDFAEEMVANNVKITNLKGERKPFTFDPEVGYWPRFYDPREILNPGRRRDAVLKDMIKKGYVDNLKQAEKLLDDIMTKRLQNPKYGNMEYAREFDVEGYEKDLDIVFDNYFPAAFKRLEVIKTYGQQGRGLLELFRNIKKESGDYVQAYAIDINKKLFGGKFEPRNPAAVAWNDLMMSYEVLTKMSFTSTIKNLSQSGNTLGLAYNKSFVKALTKIITDPKTSYDFVQRTGALLHSYATELARFEHGGDVSSEFLQNSKLMQDLVDGMKWAADKNLTVSGFKHTEIFNRILAAMTGREYAEDLFRDLKNATPGSRTYRITKKRLDNLGLKAEELLQKGSLDEYDRRIAGYTFAKKTQFVNNAMELPRFASSNNPWMQSFLLFRKFQFQQGKIVYQTLRNDPVMAAKLISSMAVAGGLSAEAVDLLQAKVRDDETLLVKLARYIGSQGGFGVWLDTIQNTLKTRHGISQAAAGVIIGDAETKISGVVEGVRDDNWDLLIQTTVKDIPIVGKPIYNWEIKED